MRTLENSIVRLLKQKPFYGQFLLQCRRRELDSSAATGITLSDGVPVLAINQTSFKLFSTDEQQALLEHLVKHLLHLHPTRLRTRQPRNWDRACDLAVNGSIANLPRESPVPARLRLPDNLSAEEYYDLLPPLALTGNGQGSVGEESDGPATDQKSWQPLDDHSIWQEADRTPHQLSERVVRQMVQTALKRSHHELPGELKRLLQPFLVPAVIPWQLILRQFVGNAGRVGRRNTWKRAHRRFGHGTPGIRKKPRLNLLIAVDVSDSTDQQQLRETFAAEILQIASSRESLLTILYCGSRIQKIKTFRRTPQAMEVYRGGGYTDLRPAFEHARQMAPPPAAVIYLTDGFGQAPRREEFPTLWVLNEEGQKPAPWGTELRLKAKDVR